MQLLEVTVDSAGTSHCDYKDEQVLHRAKGKGVMLHVAVKSTGLVTSCAGKNTLLEERYREGSM